jgi:hypothetical protein
MKLITFMISLCIILINLFIHSFNYVTYCFISPLYLFITPPFCTIMSPLLTFPFNFLYLILFSVYPIFTRLSSPTNLCLFSQNFTTLGSH